MTQEYPWASFAQRIAPVVFLIALCGCRNAQDTGPPIKQEDAAKIKSGMTLAEIEAILGPSRAATSQQVERLNDMFSKIPERARGTQSEKQTDLGWGNSQGWLAARVNDQGRAWMVASQFGGPPPKSRQDERKVYVRDFGKPPGPN